jgi:methionine synthase II (cobalamin-independent)
MSIDELNRRELELYSRVCDFVGTIEDKCEQLANSGIVQEYIQIHSEYARLANDNIEALKRGLFISWYVLTEPSWLTGIDELNSDSEEQLAKTLNDLIKNKKLDTELEWMLDYYSTWDFAFERFKRFEQFYKRATRKAGFELPESIDRELMSTRGQMGIYFNSLNIWQPKTTGNSR